MNKIKILIGIATAALAMVATSQAQTFVTNGLVAYYPFNGNAIDASGNGRNGTVVNAALAVDRFGFTNACYSFDGTSSRIDITNSAVLSPAGDFTVSLWYQRKTLSNLSVLLSKSLGWASDNTGWLVAFEPPNLIQLQAGPNFDGNSPTVIPPSNLNWHQICYTYNSTNGMSQSYLDGVLVETRTVSFQTNISTQNLTVGAQEIYIAGQYGYNFDGKIDDIRIYRRTLATNEVSQLFQLESAPIISIQKAVYITSGNLHAGTNYVVQASTDLLNWTNQGSAFTATNSTWASTNYWPVDNWNQLFFRLQQQ